jgi:hypothetical protein
VRRRLNICLDIVYVGSILLFDPRREHSSAPTAKSHSRRAQGLSRLAASSRPPEGPGLDWPEHGGTLDRLGAGGCWKPETALGWGLMCLTAPMKYRADCLCVVAAALRFLSAGTAIAARSTASEPARKMSAARTNGKLGGAIRQLRVVAPCTLPEVAVTVQECNA